MTVAVFSYFLQVNRRRRHAPSAEIIQFWLDCVGKSAGEALLGAALEAIVGSMI